MIRPLADGMKTADSRRLKRQRRLVFVKIFIVTVMLIILFSLGSGLYYLIQDKGRSERTVKALTWRIALSLSLFGLLFVGFALGILKPHPGPEYITVQSNPAKK